MAIGTFGALLDRIEDEIRDTTINLNVRDAVRNAIADYEINRYYFNENESISFTTSSSAVFYSSTELATIGNLLQIDTVRLVYSGSEYVLNRRDWQWMQRENVTQSNVGQPTDYCYYNQRLFLYPRADAAYTVQVSSVVRLPTLSATTDANAWVTEYLPESLIRNRAKFHIWANVKRDDVQAAKFADLAEDAHNRLLRETSRRLGTGLVVPTYF